MTTETVRPRSILTRPLFLAAVTLLVLNDHLLKAVCPGLLTGKLSDVTGLFAFPLGVWALLDLVSARAVGLRVLAAVAALTGIGFTLLKTSAAARALYLLPYDLAGVNAAVAPDPTDLFCLPLLAAAVLYGRRHLAAPAPRPLAPRLTRAVGGTGFVLATVATPQIPSYQFMLSPEDQAAVSQVVSGLVITHADVYVTEGARGLIWDDDPSASATVEFRCPPGVRPHALLGDGLRAVVGDSVWGFESGKLDAEPDGVWRATYGLEQLVEGSFHSNRLNVLRLTLRINQDRAVEIVCPLRPGEEVLARRLDHGNRLLGRREYAEALKVFDWLLRRTHRAQLGRAKALLGLGRKREAFQALLRVGSYDRDGLEAANLALELQPTDERALWLRCSYYMGWPGQNDARGGIEAMQAYLKAHPTGPNAQYARIWINDWKTKLARDPQRFDRRLWNEAGEEDPLSGERER